MIRGIVQEVIILCACDIRKLIHFCNDASICLSTQLPRLHHFSDTYFFEPSSIFRAHLVFLFGVCECFSLRICSLWTLLRTNHNELKNSFELCQSELTWTPITGLHDESKSRLLIEATGQLSRHRLQSFCKTLRHDERG